MELVISSRGCLLQYFLYPTPFLLLSRFRCDNITVLLLKDLSRDLTTEYGISFVGSLGNLAECRVRKKTKKSGAQCVPRSKTGLGRPKITNVSFRNTCYSSQRSQWFGTLGRRWDFPDSPDVLPPATTVVALAIRSRL